MPVSVPMPMTVMSNSPCWLPMTGLRPLGLDTYQCFHLAVVEEDSPAAVTLLNLKTGAVVGAHRTMALRTLHELVGMHLVLLTGRFELAH